jgi:hypothetical protein
LELVCEGEGNSCGSESASEGKVVAPCSLAEAAPATEDMLARAAGSKQADSCGLERDCEGEIDRCGSELAREDDVEL